MKPYLAAILLLVAGLWKFDFSPLLHTHPPRACSADGALCIEVLVPWFATSVEFVADSRVPGDVTLDVEAFLTASDVPDRSASAVLEGPGRKVVLKAARTRDTVFWPPRVQFHYQRGDRNASHDPSLPYSIPFEKGFSVLVTQAFFGKFSHKDAQAYAVDFLVPEGTPVHAAREGVVTEIVQDFTEHGLDPSFGPKANFIRVQHPDHSSGLYLHLRPQGAAVRLGQELADGDLLGYSGFTGYATEPHLHFEVKRPKSGRASETLPFSFRVGDSAYARQLQEGERVSR